MRLDREARNYINLFGIGIFKMKSACKPDSVEDNHSSRISVTTHLKRPTRKLHGPCICFPIWSCSKWGLPCHRCCHRRGALLPHHFTLTQPLTRNGRAVYFLWHFPWAYALQALPGTLPFGVRTFLRLKGSDCPADFRHTISYPAELIFRLRYKPPSQDPHPFSQPA
jgi:hypothetical protein